MKVRFPNDSSCQFRVTIPSAPFGLMSNTSQEEDLFARVFIEDAKSWKPLPTTVSHDTTASSTTTDLTMKEIVQSVERYFIRKTGIRPKDWIIPYIENVFQTACCKFLLRRTL